MVLFGEGQLTPCASDHRVERMDVVGLSEIDGCVDIVPGADDVTEVDPGEGPTQQYSEPLEVLGDRPRGKTGGREFLGAGSVT